MGVISGNLTLDELNEMIGRREIDTVLLAFPDMQGRLVGKRVSARLFQEEVAQHGAEACNYLIAVDVEMNTVAGYTLSSWETGYGDMVLKPVFDTLRLIPWLPGTAMLMADLQSVEGDPLIQSPREVLRTQLKR
ncbi:MAG: glutamine synthetase, partial [Pseudolysinimonas sp.]